MEKELKNALKSMRSKMAIKIYWAIFKSIIYIVILTSIAFLFSRTLACVVGLVLFIFFVSVVANYIIHLIDEEK